MNSFEITKLNDKKIIEEYFRKDTSLNLYQIGDLDDFFWKYTDWFALKGNGELKQVVLIYQGTDLPVMIALSSKELEEMKFLLERISQAIPDRFYSHLSVGLSEVLQNKFRGKCHGKYLKMTLNRTDLVKVNYGSEIRRMSIVNSAELKKFYDESYPDNWFDNRMLETGKYFAYFTEGQITGVAGIHVYSPHYKVAVLGNITTHPGHRGKSICSNLTSVLCEDLFESVDTIGLNVHSENIAAIRSYEKIGFKKTGKYEEYMFEKK